MYEIMIAPSVLAADFTRLGEQVTEALDAGAHLLHVDVMDGRFVPNITFGPLVVEALRRVTNAPLDVHLMIVEPERYIKQFAQAGASAITVHIEATPHLHRVLEQIKEAGCRAGVAINPHTPASAIEEVISMLDVINVMTVNPGFGGQSFIPATMSKIARLRAMVTDRQSHVDIEVDGGINIETAPYAIQAGANVLIVGTAVFSHPLGVTTGVKQIQASIAPLLD
jgi:ribulose-phosphate 3-epimerase